MKTQIHELRTRIDGLAQLVKSLDSPALIISQDYSPKDWSVEEMTDQLKETGKIVLMNQQSPIQVVSGLNFLAESYKSLLLSKAWLGKVLAELGEETPYKKYPVGVIGKTSRDAFFLAVEKGLDTKNRKECILLSTPEHFKSWVFSELILPEDLSGFSEQMLVAIKYGKEQVFIPKTVEDIEPTADAINTQCFPFNPDIGHCELNYIEKIDWLRKETQMAISKLKSLAISPFSIVITRSFEHLNEARFFLGFELSRIKEQSK